MMPDDQYDFPRMEIYICPPAEKKRKSSGPETEFRYAERRNLVCRRCCASGMMLVLIINDNRLWQSHSINWTIVIAMV